MLVDLIGPFEMTSRQNQYALTVVCMLINYVTCVTMTDKSVDTVMSAYLKDIYCGIRGTRKCPCDNGSELKT